MNEDFFEVIPKQAKKKLFGWLNLVELLYLFVVGAIWVIAAISIKWTKDNKLNLTVNLAIACAGFLTCAAMVFPARMANRDFKMYHRFLYFIKYRISKKTFTPNDTTNNTNFLTSILTINENSKIREAKKFLILGDKETNNTNKKNKKNKEVTPNSFLFGIKIEGVDFGSQSDSNILMHVEQLRNLLRLSEVEIQIVKYVTQLNTSEQAKYVEEIKANNLKLNLKSGMSEKRQDKINTFLEQVLKRYDNYAGVSQNLALFFQANDEKELINQQRILRDCFHGIKYEIMEPYEVIDVYQKMLTPWEINFDTNKIDEAVDRGMLKDFLTLNDKMDIKADHVFFNDTYYKFGCVAEFPNTARLNWLDFILKSTANTSIKISALGKEESRNFVNTNRKNLSISYQNTAKNDEMERAELEFQNDLVQGLIDSLLSGNETLHTIGIYTMVWSDTYESLENEWKTLENECLANDIRIDPMNNRQLAGITSYMLKSNFVNPKFSKAIMSAKAIALAYPFTNERLDHNFGADYGYLDKTGDRFIVETFHPTGKDYINNHELGFGASGSGKTLTINLKLMNNLAENNFTIVLDPDNEFLNMSKNLDANMIDLAAPNQILNPFDILPPLAQDEVYMSHNERKNWYMQEHLQKMRDFHELLFPDWNEDMNIILTKLLSDFYKTWEPWLELSNLDSISPNSSPTYDNFIDYLINIEKEKVVLNNYEYEQILNRFISVFQNNGVYQAKLNRRSTVVFDDNRFVVFHLKTLLDSNDNRLKNSLLRLLFSFINTHVTKYRYINDRELPKVMKKYNVTQSDAIRHLTRTSIFIDEAHKLWIGNPVAKKQIFDWYKVLRKYSARMSCWTQNITDFYGTSEYEIQLTKGIFENSQYVNIMTFRSEQELNLADQLFASTATPFTAYEKEYILKKIAGSALFMATNTKRYTVQYEIPKILTDLKLESEN